MRSYTLFLAAGVLAASSPAQAGQTASGKVYELLSHRLGRLFFSSYGARTGSPGCASINRWVIDVTTSAGQSMAATVLSAQAQGKSVTVAGTGVCDLWGDTESVDYVQIDE